MKTQITLSKAIEGYLLDAHSRRLSPRTITDYKTIFRRLLDHTGDIPLTAISPDHIRRFMADLSIHVVNPAGCAPRPPRKLSKKTARNHHIALSSLWTWALHEGFVDTHIVHDVTPPEAEKTAIEPFSRADVEAMLAACDHSGPYTRKGQKECRHSRPTAARDKALILLLLDTGARASEICAEPRKGSRGLQIQDVDHRNLTITVWGKGDKQRILRISPTTSKALWLYLTSRADAIPTDPLILGTKRDPLTTAGLLRLIKRLGERAGIPGAHPHRFRHTFAINFLRNGGTVFELQYLLGHTTLEMVQRYLKLAQVDLEEAHRRASPVTNWKL